MSLILNKLCNCIILEHFGPVVESVTNHLFKNGPRSLNYIKIDTKLPIRKLKEALCILIKFSIVVPEKTEKGIIYSLEIENILRIIKYPRYIFFVKNHCGDEAEMILEEFLKQGYETGSHVIVKTYKKLQEFPPERRSSIPVLKEKFELLIKNHFLIRAFSSISEANECQDFEIPSLNIKSITRLSQGNEADPGDDKIYWKVNFDRFTKDLRDATLVNAISKRIDINAGELMRQLLFMVEKRTASWADTSNPIPFVEIKAAVKNKDYPILSQYIDQYLRIIEDDSSQFIRRVGDSGGGQFIIDMKNAFHQLAWAVLENIIMERFGSKAARIFRIIRNHKFIEQEKIQQIAMIPAKEAKHLTYTLLEENYIQIQEIKKAGVSTAPTKIFFLFHIDLDEVVRMKMEHCYHALYNINQRREHEIVSNKRVIDKYLRLQILTSTYREHGAPAEQIKEIEDMFSAEEQLLEQVQDKIKKLGANEYDINETLFILSMYLRYH